MSVFIFISVLFLTINFVSAASFYFPSVRSVSESVVEAWVNFLGPFLEALFGGFGWTGMYLFEKLLLFIMLVAIIYVAVGKVEIFREQKVVKWVIAVVIPLIGIRFIDYEWLNVVLMTYQVVAIVLMSVLPFIIYFVFLWGVTNNPYMRKLGWLLLIFVYVGLWSTSGDPARSEIFFWTTIAAIVMMLFDSKIEYYFRLMEFRKQDRWNKEAGAAKIQDEIDKIHDQITKGSYPNKRDGEARIKELQKLKHDLIKQIY